MAAQLSKPWEVVEDVIATRRNSWDEEGEQQPQGRWMYRAKWSDKLSNASMDAWFLRRYRHEHPSGAP